MRRVIRLWLTRGLCSAIAAIVLPILSEFGVQLAAEQGFYNNPSHRFWLMVSAAADFVSSWPVFLGVSALAGLVVGLWLDTFLAGQEKKCLPKPVMHLPNCKKDLLQENVRREFARFVLTRLADGRLSCARMLMNLTTQLCRSDDKIKEWVGWGASNAQQKEHEAWEALKASIDSAQTDEELENAFANHYKHFVLAISWIPRVAFTLGCLDNYRQTNDFREVSATNDKIYSDVRDFVMLRPRLRSEVERWAHTDLMTHTPE